MQLTAIKDVYAAPGPYVTIHTEVGHTTEDADQQAQARWTTIRHELERHDVDADLLATLEQRMSRRPDFGGEARRTLVAAGGTVVLDQTLAGTTTRPERAEVSALPALDGWLDQAGRQHPFALVNADKQGADIGFHGGLAVPGADETEVEGHDFQLTKVPVGGWRHKHYQRGTEELWEANAQAVAEEVRSGIRSHRPDVVLLAGDPRARTEVESALEGVEVPIVQVESGGRAAGASDEALWDEITRHLDALEARTGEELVDRLQERDGELAARGIQEVVGALVKGQVAELLLDLDALDGQVIDPADHAGLDVGASGALPADRVLLAAAVATDAGVRVLPREQTVGTGVDAVLRWSDADSPDATE